MPFLRFILKLVQYICKIWKGQAHITRLVMAHAIEKGKWCNSTAVPATVSMDGTR